MESKKINQLATELAPVLSDLTIIGDPTTGISKKITLSQMASLFTGTVEEYPNLASFPLVGTADTIYIALDTNIIYRWNTGTNAYVELSPNIVTSLVFNDANGFDGTISLVGSTATLTITTALTTGSVPFIGTSGALTQDNANLFFDDTNNRLGINTSSPTTALDVFGSGIIGRINGTSTNNAFLGFSSAGTNKWSIGNVQSDHRFRIFSETNTSELVSVLQTGEFGIGIANPTTKIHIDGGATALIANLDANVSVAKSVSFRSDNSNRINLEVSGTESGSNAGANLFIRRYSDAGALIDTPLTITRSTGAITLAGALSGTTASFTGLIRTDLGAAGTSAVFNAAGSNFQINHDGTSAISLLNTGGGGYIFKAADTTTTIFSLSNAGAGVFTNSLQSASLNVAGSGYFPAKLITLTGAEPTRYSGNIGLNIVSGSILGMSFGTRNNNINYDNTLNLVNGNVGISTISPGEKLWVNLATNINFAIGGTTRTRILGVNDANNNFCDISLEGSNVLFFAGGTQKAVITSVGNVGIKTASPDVDLLVGATSTLTATATPTTIALDNSYFNGTTSGDKLKLYILRGGVNIGLGAGNIGDFNIWCDGLTRFYNGGIERMRITSSGYLKLREAVTSTTEVHILRADTTTDAVAQVVNANTSTTSDGMFTVVASRNTSNNTFYALGYYNSGAGNWKFRVADSGNVTNTNNSYGVLSDIKLKENIVDATPKLENLLKVKIRNYNLIGEETKQLGVIAQELEEIFPSMVDESEDFEEVEIIDEEGNVTKEKQSLGTTTKSVKMSVFVPMLIKAIQEQQAQIEELKALINK
jgi:hypothetical protein